MGQFKLLSATVALTVLIWTVAEQMTTAEAEFTARIAVQSPPNSALVLTQAADGPEFYWITVNGRQTVVEELRDAPPAALTIRSSSLTAFGSTPCCLATFSRSPGVSRSASNWCDPSPTHTSVPTGTTSVMSSPFLPCFSLPWPFSPSPALKDLRYLYETRVLRLRSLRRNTLPPSPPFPPSGPPRGTYFSRRPLIAPSPPLPLAICISTLSIMSLGS